MLGLNVIFFRRWIPESPRWLMIHGRNRQAEQIVADVERKIAAKRSDGALEYWSDASTQNRLLHHSITPSLQFGAHSHTYALARDLGRDCARASPAFVSWFCADVNAGIFLQCDLFHLRACADAVLLRAGENVGSYLLPFALGNVLGPLLLGHLFDTIGRKQMITLTYGLAGILLAVTGWLFHAGVLTAQTQTLAWTIIFFIASAAASSAYLTVSEIFPLEIRAMAIAIFYAIGTLIGGVGAPLLFGWIIGTGSITALIYRISGGGGFYDFCGGDREAWIGVASRATLA